jgi:hypothetical protein
MQRRCVLASLTVAAAWPAWAEPAGISFSITGSESAEIACRVMRDGAVSDEDHSGRLPVDLRFEADAVTCSVTADGQFVIEAASSEGNRSRAQSSGGQMVVSISQ